MLTETEKKVELLHATGFIVWIKLTDSTPTQCLMGISIRCMEIFPIREVVLKPNLQLSVVLSMYLADKSKPKSPGRHLDLYFPGRVTLALTYVVPDSVYCGCS